MTITTKVTPGRLDGLVKAMLEAGLKAHGSAGLRIAARMAEGPISQALTETLGPGTRAGDWAANVVAFANEFEKKFLEAQKAIAAEDSRR